MRLHRVAVPLAVVVAAATGARELEVGWSTHLLSERGQEFLGGVGDEKRHELIKPAESL